MALTAKQQAFVREYLVDLNATQAAIRAGYRGKYQNRIGPELLVKTSISKAIAEAMAERSQRTQVGTDRVLQEIARIAFADHRKFYKPDGSLKAPHELGDDEAAALAGSEVREELGGDGQGGKEVVAHIKKIKQWDKNSALEKLCKHLGMFKNDAQVQINTDGQVTIYLPEKKQSDE